MRSVWKGPFCDWSLFKMLNKHKKDKKFIMKTRCRSSTILIDFIGYVFHVYNGKKYIPVKVNVNMVGMKFGEFSPTRTFHGHTGDKKAVKK